MILIHVMNAQEEHVTEVVQRKWMNKLKGGSMKINTRGVIKKEKLVELMKDVEMLQDEVLMAAEKILELPSMDFGKMSQKEADLISEPKD